MGRGSTTLRRLHVSPPNPWEDEEDGLARPYGALRDPAAENERRAGELHGGDTALPPLFLEDESDGLDALLRSHNFTLRNVVQRVAHLPSSDDDPPGQTSAQEDRINRLLDGNAQMREDYARAVVEWASAARRAHRPTAVLRLWPEMIQRFSAFPTLVYRFLRPHPDSLVATGALLGGGGSAGVVVGQK
jgi:hypothetical protein